MISAIFKLFAAASAVLIVIGLAGHLTHVAVAANQMSGDDFMAWIMVLSTVILVVFAYLLPSLVAKSRNVADMHWLVLVNFLIGWTGLGWVLCMAWAVFGQTRDQQRFYAKHL